MKTKSKKAEFFMISIAIILLFMLTLLGFPKSAVQSTHFSEINYNSEIMKLIEAKNSGNFWNYTWQSQMKISSASNETGRLKIENFEISSGFACEEDIVVLNSAKSEIDSDTVSVGIGLCDIAFEIEPNKKYYIIYNAFYPYTASYSRAMPSGEFNKTYTEIADKTHNFCIYSKESIGSKADFNCTILEQNKISISYESPKIMYSGVI